MLRGLARYHWFYDHHHHLNRTPTREEVTLPYTPNGMVNEKLDPVELEKILEEFIYAAGLEEHERWGGINVQGAISPSMTEARQVLDDLLAAAASQVADVNHSQAMDIVDISDDDEDEAPMTGQTYSGYANPFVPQASSSTNPSRDKGKGPAVEDQEACVRFDPSYTVNAWNLHLGSGQYNVTRTHYVSPFHHLDLDEAALEQAGPSTTRDGVRVSNDSAPVPIPVHHTLVLCPINIPAHDEAAPIAEKSRA